MLDCFEVSQIDALGALTLFFCFAIFHLLYRAGNSYFFGRIYFVVALVSMLLWLFAVFMEITSQTAACKVLWSSAAWPAIMLVPTTWLLFLIDYINGRSESPKGWRKAILWVGPLVALLTVATNPLHQLFYGPGSAPVAVRGGIAMDFDHGPLFYLLLVYLYGLMLYAMAISLRGAFVARPQHRMFYIGIFLVTLAPAISDLAYMALDFTIQGYDPTPFAFSVSLLILLVMVAQNRLMDVGAIARDLLFSNSPDPILVLDVNGELVGRNPEARRLFAAEPGSESPAHELREFIDEILQTGGAPMRRTLTVRNRHFDPDVFPVDQHVGRPGTVVGWVLRLQDSTERRFLSGALQAERDFLSRLMETSMAGILVLDAAGEITFINAEAERILGLEGQAIRDISLNDPAWRFEWPEGAPSTDLVEAFADLALNATPLRNRLVSLQRRADGERRVISVNASQLASPDTEARIVASLADVTDQYRTEIHLRDAAARSESANRSKSQFIANMSHEIRTPLNGVLGMAEVLDRLIKDAEQKRMITTIRHSGELLLTILNDVLDMSKIEAGKLELEAALFRPDHLAARIEELFTVSADEKQLAFEVFTSGRADLQRIGDPHRLMQIMQNLVSNAIKFTHDGEIMVTFSCAIGKPMIVEVRDTGIGMSSEQVERIFRPFEQADGSVTRRFGGTGLGMAIVAKLVELMHGQIEVASELGEGTTIRLVLPLEQA
ncbi:histidine kinase N-terminal 7TM domain-containing protein [Gemmobacter sp.]|uniref:sensor histidine kinase n=1 Tax=Gemmobacter sp. TaxID=1898957 RepID=UPI002AFF8B58|nr:histidine kinase N-terminal 7TM domain-containing protein [Gemmobacter sp.]